MSRALAAERIAAVDLLRGAAMFGILSVNIWYFASASLASGVADPDFVTPLDRAAYALVTFLFAAKSYLLFAFLFGYSFVLQEQAAQRAGRPFRRPMARRLVGLMVLGVLHGLLLYPGDILLTYGLLGFVLLALRHLAPGDAMRAGVLATVASGCLVVFIGLLASLAGEVQAQVPGAVHEAEAAYRGSAAQVLLRNAAGYPTSLASIIFLQALPALGAMLVGLAAARADVLRSPERLAAVRARLLPFGPVVGLLGAGLFTWAIGSDHVGPLLVGYGVTILTAPLLTASYVLVLLEWHRRKPNGRLRRAMAATGRLALSNYLAQSLAMALLFTGYGAALMERVTASQTVGIAVAIYCVQLAVSSWWVKSHRYGPAEWVLRRWTFGGASDATARLGRRPS